jgi:hypothetical protein
VKFVYSFHMARLDPFTEKLNTPRCYLALAITTFYGWLYFSQWLPLAIQNIGGGRSYADLASVLNAAQCYERIGDSVYSSGETCGYQYGIFLLQFINLFKLNSIALELLGGLLFLIVFLILLGIAVYSAKTRRKAVVIFFLAISPGPWLLFERGNFDLLVLIIVSLAVLFVGSRLSMLAVFLIALSALMKFYTLPLLLLYIMIEKRLYLKFTAGVTSAFITYFVLSDISSAPGFPNPTFVAFGLPSPGLWLNFFAWRFNVPIELNGLLQYLVGALFFLGGFYLMYFSHLQGKLSFTQLSVPTGSNLAKNAFLFSSSLYLICFLAGMNYDYRLIFLILSLSLLNVVFPSSQSSRWFLAIQMTALWATIFFFGISGPVHVFLAIFGNASQLILAVYLLGPIYQVLKSSPELKLVVRVTSKFSRRRS